MSWNRIIMVELTSDKRGDNISFPATFYVEQC